MSKLRTPEEWMDNPTNDFWVHGLAMVSHLLQGRKARRAWDGRYKDSTDHVHARDGSFHGGAREERRRFNATVEATFKKKPRFTQRRGFEGDFDVDGWLERGGLELKPDAPQDFFMESVKEPRDDMSTLTIVLDASVPYDHRGDGTMQERHRQSYQLALRAEGDGRPCRVVTFSRQNYPEMDPLNWLTIVKDFDDPIFPGIWGVFATSIAANAVLNVAANAMFGTKCSGNGYSRYVKASEIAAKFFPDETVYFAQPTKLIRMDIDQENI